MKSRAVKTEQVKAEQNELESPELSFEQKKATRGFQIRSGLKAGCGSMGSWTVCPPWSDTLDRYTG